MTFQKGRKKTGGRQKGSGRNSECAAWAERYGIPFLIRIAEGKEKDINLFGKPVKVGLTKRKEVAMYLIDQGIGRAPQRHEVSGAGGEPITIMFVPFDGPDKG